MSRNRWVTPPPLAGVLEPAHRPPCARSTRCRMLSWCAANTVAPLLLGGSHDVRLRHAQLRGAARPRARARLFRAAAHRLRRQFRSRPRMEPTGPGPHASRNITDPGPHVPLVSCSPPVRHLWESSAGLYIYIYIYVCVYTYTYAYASSTGRPERSRPSGAGPSPSTLTLTSHLSPLTPHPSPLTLTLTPHPHPHPSPSPSRLTSKPHISPSPTPPP